MTNEFDYVRKTYGVMASKGGRVEYTGGDEPQLGTITGVDGGYVSIRLDGKKYSSSFHPTWELRYLEPDTSHDQR